MLPGELCAPNFCIQKHVNIFPFCFDTCVHYSDQSNPRNHFDINEQLIALCFVYFFLFQSIVISFIPHMMREFQPVIHVKYFNSEYNQIVKHEN